MSTRKRKKKGEIRREKGRKTKEFAPRGLAVILIHLSVTFVGYWYFFLFLEHPCTHTFLYLLFSPFPMASANMTPLVCAFAWAGQDGFFVLLLRPNVRPFYILPRTSPTPTSHHAYAHTPSRRLPTLTTRTFPRHALGLCLLRLATRVV